MGGFYLVNRILVIIEAGHVESARALLQVPPFEQTAEQAETTFVPAGSPTGQRPATHFWCSSDMTPESWAACQQLCSGLPWAECFEYDAATAPGLPAQKLAELGLQSIHPNAVSNATLMGPRTKAALNTLINSLGGGTPL